MRSKTIEAANRLRFHRLMGALAIGILTLIFITVGPLLFGGKDSTPVAIDPVLTEVEAPEIEKNSAEEFNQLLFSDDIRVLKRRLAELQEESGLPVVLRLNNIARQIALASRLKELNLDQETYDGVIEGMLLAMNRRESLAIKHAIYSAKSVEQTVEFVTKPEVANHPRHHELAAATLALTAVSEFLFERQTGYRVKQRHDALETFRSVANRNRESELLAEKLYQLIGLIQDKGVFTESDPFVQAFIDSFTGSQNKKIDELVDEMKLVWRQTQAIFPNLLEKNRFKRDENVRKFSELVQQELSDKEANSAVVVSAIEQLGRLVRIGRIDDAIFLKSIVSSYVNGSHDAKTKMAEVDRMLDVSARTFIPSGILKSDGLSINDADLKRSTILLFVSPTTTDRDIQVVKTVGKSLGNRYRDEQLSFSLVVVRDNVDQQPSKELVQIAERGELEIWYLNRDSDSGQAFIRGLPIDKLPFCVILQDGRRIIALDPPPDVAGQIVFAN